MTGMEAKEEDEEEEEKKKIIKLELRKTNFIITMFGTGLLLLLWGLQRGYPLWTCFLVFF